MTSFPRHCIRLPSVFGDVGVDIGDYIWTDRRLHDGGKGNGGAVSGHIIFQALHGGGWDGGSGGHCRGRGGGLLGFFGRIETLKRKLGFRSEI